MKNYIGNNNKINKKKYKKSLSPFMKLDAGNVDYNIDTFNRISDVGSVPSSAEGMSGIAEDYDVNELKAEIRSYGYPFSNYHLENKSVAALLDILNDAKELQKDKIKYIPKRKNTIDLNVDRHIMNDDPKYNFEDPDREGDYKVEQLTIRESLNRLDHKAIENDDIFYDLRSLYEGIEPKLTSQEKVELKNLINTTNDPDVIKSYIDSKNPDKEKNEGLDYDNADRYWALMKYTPGSRETGIYGDKFDYVDWVHGTEAEAYRKFKLKRLRDPEHLFIQEISQDDFKDLTEDMSDILYESSKNLTFDELLQLAKEHYTEGGSDIIEFWDEDSFDMYEKEFGPMSKKTALKLMKVMKGVEDDEFESGRYFADQTVEPEYRENYSINNNTSSKCVEVVDDETKQVVSRHRGEDALEKASKEKDVMNMNEADNLSRKPFTVMFFHDGDTYTGIIYSKSLSEARKKFTEYCPSCKIDRIKPGRLGFEYPIVTSSFEYDMGWEEEDDPGFEEWLYKNYSIYSDDLTDDDYDMYYEKYMRDMQFIDEAVEDTRKFDDVALDIYINEFKEAEDIEDLQDIVHEIYTYSKPLFVKLRHFPKNKSFEELRDEKIKILEKEKGQNKKILYIIKDKHGNQLSSPNEDQDELWDRVSAMEQRGKRGLTVVAYVKQF